MKNYTITVNGNVYDVTVEEGNGSTVATPQPTAVKAAPQPAAKPAVQQGAQGNVKINAPMPGKILAIKASVGQNVKKGDVILLLEAMKMENEVVAPEDGTVASMNAAVGNMVEAGDILATLNK